jgi:hypothetical protein
MKKNLFLLLSVVLTMSGCVTMIDSFVQTGNSYAALSEGQNVKVVLSGEKPAMEEIGMIEIKTTLAVPMNDAVEKAKKIASSKGGNTIYLQKQDKAMTAQNGALLYYFLAGRINQ